MATRAAIEGMKAEAHRRAMAAEARLVELLGLVPPPPVPFARQPEFVQAQELARHADVLEQIVDRLLADFPELTREEL